MAIWITLWLFKLIESLPSKRIISIHPLFFLAMFRPSPERRGPAPGYLQPVDRFPHQPATWQRCAREMSAHVGHFETSRIPKKKSIHSGIVCLFLRFFFRVHLNRFVTHPHAIAGFSSQVCFLQSVWCRRKALPGVLGDPGFGSSKEICQNAGTLLFPK